MFCPAGGEIYVTQEEQYEVLPGTEKCSRKDFALFLLMFLFYAPAGIKCGTAPGCFLDISVDSVGNLLYYLISTIVH